MRKLRWKALSILRPFGCSKQTYGFRSTNNPPFIPELKSFEDEFLGLSSSIKFRSSNNNFQSQLKKDKKEIVNTPYVIVRADKTQNMYKMDPLAYKKKMLECVSTTYKKCPLEKVDQVTREAAKIAREFDLADRIDIPTEHKAFFLIKDHKDSFPGKMECRIINPAKNWLGVVSKHILDRVNKSLRSSTGFNQWSNTGAAIKWFQSINNKQDKSFFKFDLTSFYPSITEQLLMNAVTWARTITNISEQELKVIRHCRRNFLFFQNECWVKKENEAFDVGMGSPDSAEVCELAGLFILSELEQLIPKEQIGLYRDDGLAVVKLPGPGIERLRKSVVKLFSQHNLKITTEVNTKITDFLDVQFNLLDGSFRPHRKDNTAPLYINNLSNHPGHIKKELPKMIGRRISDLSSNREIFNSEAPFYNQALRSAGYQEDIQFQERTEVEGGRTRKRKRNSTWFNPPFNNEVSTNVARKFLCMISRHFPRDSPLGKHLNRNTVKVSYRTLPNMQSIISGHNKKVLGSGQRLVEKGCNCRVPRDCPLDGRCLSNDVIYKNTVTSSDGVREYIGLTSTSFKTRFTAHKASFCHSNKAHCTALSSHIWDLKNKDIPFSSSWSIASMAPSYSRKTRNCQLCLMEKTLISLADPARSLNKRNEIISKCRHRDKILLKNY